jgi:hypothetical protein
MAIKSTAVTSVGAAALLVIGMIATTAIGLWTSHMREAGNTYHLSKAFYYLFAYDDCLAAFVSLLILVAAYLGFRHVSAIFFVKWVGEHPLIIASAAAAVLGVGTLTLYQNHPLAMDEYAAYFQSEVFAAGQLHGKFPVPLLDWLIPRGFQDYFLNVSRITGDVAETYWPGFALLLAPFTWAGIPWLCNPVITALTLITIHRLAIALFHERQAAGFAVLLTIASPVVFADGISYYSMAAHLLANSVFALLLVQPTPLRAATAGVVGSIALTLHNPVPHILFATPWVIWMVTRKDSARPWIALIAGYLPLCALLGLGWFIYSGHLVSEDLASSSSLIASHRLQSMIRIFSPPDATVVLARSIGMAKIWVWAVPGIVILAITGAHRHRGNTICRLLTASAILTLVGYFFVPVDQGHGWGYRYFHSAWMILPLLATAALFPVAASAAGAGIQKPLFQDSDTKKFVAGCILITLVFGVGVRGWQIQKFIATDLRQVPQFHGIHPHIMILDTRTSFYGADLVQNDPWLREKKIRMYSHGTVADAEMMERYYPAFQKVYEDNYGTVWSCSSDMASSR